MMSGCNTISGAGQDIEAIGQANEDVAKDACEAAEDAAFVNILRRPMQAKLIQNLSLMIIAFQAKSHADVICVGDVAKKLLCLMRRSAAVPSAMYAEDISAELNQLRTALEEDSVDGPKEPEPGSQVDKPPIGLAVRALPLIEMLEVAHRENELVSWK